MDYRSRRRVILIHVLKGGRNMEERICECSHAERWHDNEDAHCDKCECVDFIADRSLREPITRRADEPQMNLPLYDQKEYYGRKIH
jgi:hypothetical protein